MVHTQQNVVPRHRKGLNFSLHRIGENGWRTKRVRMNMPSRLLSQRGSITQSTITLSVGLLALVTVSVLGFVYLQQVFGTASQGADIQALEQKMDELQQTQRSLELEGAQLRSIQAVEDRVQELNLIESDAVAYLAPAPIDRVALNN